MRKPTYVHFEYGCPCCDQEKCPAFNMEEVSISLHGKRIQTWAMGTMGLLRGWLEWLSGLTSNFLQTIIAILRFMHYIERSVSLGLWSFMLPHGLVPSGVAVGGLSLHWKQRLARQKIHSTSSLPEDPSTPRLRPQSTHIESTLMSKYISKGSGPPAEIIISAPY